MVKKFPCPEILMLLLRLIFMITFNGKAAEGTAAFLEELFFEYIC